MKEYEVNQARSHGALVSPGGEFYSKCEGKPLDSANQQCDIIRLMLPEWGKRRQLRYLPGS